MQGEKSGAQVVMGGREVVRLFELADSMQRASSKHRGSIVNFLKKLTFELMFEEQGRLPIQ